MVTKRLQYRYDAMGNKVGMTDADGGLFTYTYDVMRRLTGVINPLGERTTYTYDLNGRRTSAQLANGTRTSYWYDQGSRVQQIHTLKSNNSTVAKFDYAYDNNGRRTSVLEADGSRVTWTYDGTSQVTSEWRTGTSPFRHTFVYDTRGNRTLKIEDGARTTLVYDAANQLSSSEDVGGTTNYTYDANGNQHVTVTPGGSRTTQIWDYENRLVKTLQPGGGVFTMAYDADGLRVWKETPSETKLFVWDDQNYLAETDDSGVTEVAYTTEPSTYGSTISHQSGGATTTYHFDALAAARVLTNASETVLESYNYTAFGTVLGSPTLLTPFLWGGLVGYYWDADLATQYIRARHYQPHIARWISLDPIGFAGGDANLFRYVGNSPTSLSTSMLWALHRFIPKPVNQPISRARSMYDFLASSSKAFGNGVQVAFDPSGLLGCGTHWVEFSRGNDDLGGGVGGMNYQTASICIGLDDLRISVYTVSGGSSAAGSCGVSYYIRGCQALAKLNYVATLVMPWQGDPINLPFFGTYDVLHNSYYLYFNGRYAPLKLAYTRGSGIPPVLSGAINIRGATRQMGGSTTIVGSVWHDETWHDHQEQNIEVTIEFTKTCELSCVSIELTSLPKEGKLQTDLIRTTGYGGKICNRVVTTTPHPPRPSYP
ncbi:MAG: RHS repeat-associated core domain-containing protein [Planctomycetaceae bacterium]